MPFLLVVRWDIVDWVACNFSLTITYFCSDWCVYFSLLIQLHRFFRFERLIFYAISMIDRLLNEWKKSQQPNLI